MTEAPDDGRTTAAPRPLSRRDRLRAATKDEIIATARRLLVDEGPDAVSLRAIAREMGMTAPGLYRYFASYEELLRYMIAGIFTELAQDIHRAISSAAAEFGLADEEEAAPDEAAAHKDPRHLTAEMAASCGEFRRWALSHPAEFTLVFGVPLPGIDDGRYDIASECALQFAGVYFTLFLKL